MTKPTMSDDELIRYLGCENEPNARAFVQGLTAERRAVFDRMATIEIEIDLWQAGLGPKPQGVLIDMPRGKRR
jgi:hypothetical protein